MAIQNRTDWQVEVFHIDEMTGVETSRDISADVEEISSLSNSLDIPDLTEYTVSELSLVIFNHNYDYSPDKDPNFFRDLGYSPNGFRARIRVKARIVEGSNDLETLFSGRIIELTHELQPGTFRVIAVDRRVDLQNNPLTNFGLEKNNNIARVIRRGARGQHIFADSVIPISRESVTDGILTDSLYHLNQSPMEEKQTLRDEGDLQPRFFKVDEDGTGIETEAVAGDNASVNLNYRAPFRGITIERAIREILKRYDITPRGINIPTIATDDELWNSRGRPAYEIESVSPTSGRNEHLFQWRGQITDYLHNPDTNEFFFLYSHRNSPTRPALLRFRVSDGTWTKLFESCNHYEWWQLATKNFETFYILQSASNYNPDGLPRYGTYNPSLSASVTDTNCLRLALTFDANGGVASSSPTELLTTANLRPQLSMHYWYGFRNTLPRSWKTNSNYGYLPDTRHGFEIAGNALWYRYASTRHFGLARNPLDSNAPQSVIQINRDTFQNEASFDFVIETDTDDDKTPLNIYGSHTNMERVGMSLQSKLLVYKLDTIPSNL